MSIPNIDSISRTALIGVHDGTQPTLEAALATHASTGIVIIADHDICGRVTGQAALCTAIATAARAFGTVTVIADGDTLISAGPYRGRSIAAFVAAEHASLAGDMRNVPTHWPTLVIGQVAAELSDGLARRPVVLRIGWNSWTSYVAPSTVPTPVPNSSPSNVITAICAGAIGVHEAFGTVLARPGSDAGYRSYRLNLWRPGTDMDDGPDLTHAPADWWLIGLGHLGQAHAWVISWLTYTNPSDVSIILQDVDKAVDANHSTGILTPHHPDPIRKTRIVAAALDPLGFDTHIIEQRLGDNTRVATDDAHVALLGVDNLPTRRTISAIGWPLAIDVGLGTGPTDFNAILLRRFPADQNSDQIPGWADTSPRSTDVPDSPAFDDLKHRDPCGVVQLAGTAVGAAFVGVIAACLAISEATRELLGGTGFDIVNMHLQSADVDTAASSHTADVVPARLSIDV